MGKFNVVKSKKFTKEELQEKFPAKRNTITDEVVEYINSTISDPDFDSSTFMSHLIDYQTIMMETSASMRDYINAMKFCAYLESNHSITEAYKKARINDEFVQKRLNAKSNTPEYNELTNAASRYRKSKLVRQILAQSDMPLYLMFQAERYKAVAVLAQEMFSAPYSKDRINAADKLLTHVKPPENQKVELEVGLNQNAQDMQTKLFEQLSKISEGQHARLVNGEDIKDVQRVGITTEFVEAEPEE